ncbi:thioesterase [Pseudalgibacter alginicilyticus]|uniref:Thioesterase n=1 Tax=Pseudalgibacter alginicilyticus TaxID=1736674 RepID=A0A0P0D912_9FLAO|nr:hotdog domain-containing protein [Pseudalgibacter alginicilyticus]ALJ04245.1 thioesterase [Pseudalgibacter alginicilyticus]
MTINTHHLASKKLIGTATSLEKNSAIVKLTISPDMIVDTYNLSHGGFVFGLADYAAMLAINKPTVVLGKATTKFIKPVVLNDEVTAFAHVIESSDEKKITVSVIVKNQNQVLVFEGEFVCFVLDKHILES